MAEKYLLVYVQLNNKTRTKKQSNETRNVNGKKESSVTRKVLYLKKKKV
jgi:hypothetical protein